MQVARFLSSLEHAIIKHHCPKCLNKEDANRAQYLEWWRRLLMREIDFHGVSRNSAWLCECSSLSIRPVGC